MSKLSEAIDWNRKKQKEYSLESTGTAKPKSYLSQSIDSIRQGRGIPRRSTPLQHRDSTSTTTPYTGGRQGTQPGRVSMDGSSYTALTPKPGMSDEEELRWESR